MRFAPLALFALLALGSCASCATPQATPIDAAPPDTDTDTGESRMAAFTFTANAGTDQLTITSHGLNTGDGPIAVRNVGGALPTGLTALTDYWVIRVDANSLKLAASSTLAFAGTSIDLTTNGTGTNILEIGVPYRRPRTYAAGVQLASADLNANFDTWKAMHALLTAQSQSVWSDATLAVPLTVSDVVTATNYKYTAGREMAINATSGTALVGNWVNDVSTGQFKTSAGNGILAVSIPLDVGDRVTAATFTMIGDGSADVSVALAMMSSGMTPTNLATLTVNNEGAAWTTKTLTVTPRTLATGESAVITFLSSAAGLSIGNINITRTRP